MLVDLILTDRRYHTFEGYAARQVSLALEALGTAHRTIYLSEGGLQDYLSSLDDTAPDWTVSFTALTPHYKPLCDVIQIPHFYWVEGSLAPARHFLDSTYGKLGLTDPHLCSQLASPRALYLPHGVEKREGRAKQFGMVLFADLLDLPFLEKTWHEVAGAVEIEAIRKGIQVGDPLQAGRHFFYAEQYLLAHKLQRDIETLKGIGLDLFGEHEGDNWLTRLPSTVHLHAPLPYTEHFEVLKASALTLADPSTPWYRAAIGAGCLPLPPDAEQIKYYLTHPHEREKEVSRLAASLPEWTWRHQTEHLIEAMR